MDDKKKPQEDADNFTNKEVLSSIATVSIGVLILLTVSSVIQTSNPSSVKYFHAIQFWATVGIIPFLLAAFFTISFNKSEVFHMLIFGKDPPKKGQEKNSSEAPVQLSNNESEREGYEKEKDEIIKRRNISMLKGLALLKIGYGWLIVVVIIITYETYFIFGHN